MARLSAFGRRLRQRLVAEVCRRVYRDRGSTAMPTAMLVGTARSGTTWLAELIDSQVPCRLMFEPFHPELVPEFSGFEYFQYARPDERNDELLAFCARLRCGELRGRWIDGHLAHVRPRLRLIKDIRSTLMLRWFHDRFSDVPLMYVLRHPCAVVLSRMRLGWATDDDIRRFVRQPRLVADHLQPYAGVIDGARTDEEKHAIVWCISNMVPLRQFADGGWTLLYYERLRHRPEYEMPRLFDALGCRFDPGVFSAMQRPSRTTRRGAGGSADGVGAAWMRDLTEEQIRRVLGIVNAFGLGHIYGEDSMPLWTAPSTGPEGERRVSTVAV